MNNPATLKLLTRRNLPHLKLVAAAVAAASASLVSLPGIAQEENVLEEVLVTGSKIRRSPLERPAPVNTLTAADMERTGLNSVGDILQQLPNSGGAINSRFNNSGNSGFPPDGGGVGAGASQVDLRYLGSKRTLVLVDGVRWVHGASASGVGSASDLNTIPTAIIERIEVLEDGASAIYGSDAIAGVVNIITKKKFEGLELNGYFGEYDEGDGTTTEYSASWGVSNDTTNVFLSLSYSDAEEVRAEDRDISSFPTPNVGRCLANCSSGTPQGRFYFIDADGNDVDLALNDGVDGIPRYDPSNPGGGNDDFHGFTTADRFNFSPYNLVMVPVERTNLFGQVSQQLTDRITLNFKGMYNNRQSANQAAPEPLFIGPSAANGNLMDTIGVHVTNPYNPFGMTLDADNFVFAGRRPLESGVRRFEQDVDTVYVSGGLAGDFEFADRSFFWDFTASWSRNSASQLKDGAHNSAHLKTALGPLDVCEATVGCVPFNFFGGQGADGNGTITPEMLAWVGFVQKDESEQELLDFVANMSGTVVTLPAGDLGFAVGFEHREQEGWFQPDGVVVFGESAGIPAQPTSGDYEVDEYFLELSVPLLKDAPMAYALDLSYAIRSFDYDTIGSDTTSKYGVNWKPVEDLLFRASYSEGFRAPGIGELFGSAARFDVQMDDPCSDLNNQADANIRANCVALGVPSDGSYTQFNAQISVATGGNPELTEETSESTMFGVVYSPSWAESWNWVEGLDLEVNYYDIEVEDAIQALEAQVQLNGCVNTLDPAMCNGISRTSGGVINGFANALTNIGGIETSGYDITLTYASPDTDYGTFMVTWSSTILDEYTEIIPTSTGFVDLKREGTSNGDPEKSWPELKSNFVLQWMMGNWSASWTARYIDEVTESCPSFVQSQSLGLCSDEVNGFNDMDDVLYNDIQVSWRPEFAQDRLSLTLGGNNVFDEDAPECFSCQLNNFDATTHDLPGQFFYTSLSYRLD